jgi:hypothetical protein
VAGGERVVKDYIRQLSAGEVIVGSVRVYLSDFGRIAAIYAGPLLPLIAINAALATEREPILDLIVSLSLTLVSLFTTAALTLAVGDLCLQMPISVRRSYSRLGPVRGKLVTTWLLAAICVLGFLVLIIPGIVAAVFYMFAMSVVALERIGGSEALRRSRELGRGKMLRNFGILVVELILVMICSTVVMVLFGLIMALLGTPWIILFLLAISIQLTFPPFIIATVLMYYDMRARKEAYDSTALAAELIR